MSNVSPHKTPSPLKPNPWTAFTIVVASILIGVVTFFSSEEATLIKDLSAGLLGFTGATFTIIGIWLTLLNPLAIFDPDKEQDKDKKQLVEKLRPFFKLSISLFAISVMLRLLIAVVPPAAENVGEVLNALLTGYFDVSFQASDTSVEVLVGVVRVASGSIVVGLYLVQIIIILANLIPIFDAETKEKDESWRSLLNKKSGQHTRR